jgi:hypothetical protein
VRQPAGSRRGINANRARHAAVSGQGEGSVGKSPDTRVQRRIAADLTAAANASPAVTPATQVAVLAPQ